VKDSRHEVSGVVRTPVGPVLGAVAAAVATAGARGAVAHTDGGAPAKHVVLTVERMTCDGGAAAVKMAPKKAHGVRDALADYKTGTAEITELETRLGLGAASPGGLRTGEGLERLRHPDHQEYADCTKYQLAGAAGPVLFAKSPGKNRP
jgi:copper chaperone CopZ